MPTKTKFMEKDFSVLGREKFLSQVYFDIHGKHEKWESNFARWTLLERVIWEFMPENTYCHLDGFDLNNQHYYKNGFIGIGRVWLLENNHSAGDVYTTMAIEFDEGRMAVKNGKFWVSHRPVIKGDMPPDVDIPPIRKLFSNRSTLGRDWQLALIRNSSGWSINPQFDLSIFLNFKSKEGQGR